MAATDQPPLPTETNIIFLDLLEKYNSAETAEEKQLALIKLLEAHAFVKKGETQTIQFENISFDVTGYQLDIGTFRKFLKTPEGAEFKAIAGGFSDDGLYTVSPFLREHMPRGFHEVIAYQGEKQVGYWHFKGISKFTGVTPGDEDEESNSTTQNFFYGGATMDDCISFYSTRKSNGENAKFRLIEVADRFFFFAGSKNTCLVFPADEPSTIRHSIDDGEYPGPIIADLVSKWYLSLDEATRAEFQQLALRFGSFLGEVNRENSEHIIPVPETYIEFYSILDQTTNRSIPPDQADYIFKRFQLPAVPMIHHEISELPTVIVEIRGDSTVEGAVLYLLDAQRVVIGLVKVKSNHYVIVRRIREAFKGAITLPLSQGLIAEFPKEGGKIGKKPIEPLEVIVTAAKKTITPKMRGLNHVPGCAEKWEDWNRVVQAFIDWFAEKLLAVTPEAVDAWVQEMIEERFASTYALFLTETGNAMFE